MATNKVIYQGNVLMDVTDSTVTPETLGEGVIAYAANGERIVGTGAGSGVSSWNDLKDKPFGYEEVVFLPETELVFTNNMAMFTPVGVFSEVGVYRVTFNGKEYECVSTTSGYSGIIGNPIAFEGEDNGMPFAIITMLQDDDSLAGIVVSLAGESNATIKIIHRVPKTIHNDFLPKPEVVDFITFDDVRAQTGETCTAKLTDDVKRNLESQFRNAGLQGICRCNLAIHLQCDNGYISATAIIPMFIVNADAQYMLTSVYLDNVITVLYDIRDGSLSVTARRLSYHN